MCGRYNFTAEEAAEIRVIIEEIQRKLNTGPIKSGEIYPTNFVPVLVPGDGRPEPVPMTWGFPNFARGSKSAVVINARSETVLEKRMFAQSVLNRRYVVPSTGFGTIKAQALRLSACAYSFTLVERIRSYDEEIKAVVESTSAYLISSSHLPILSYLQDEGVFVSAVNPLLMKKYASVSIRKAKTDKGSSSY